MERVRAQCQKKCKRKKKAERYDKNEKKTETIPGIQLKGGKKNSYRIGFCDFSSFYSSALTSAVFALLADEEGRGHAVWIVAILQW